MKKYKKIIYLFAILSIFFTSCEEIFEDDLRDQKPVIIAPKDSTIAISPVNLYWEQLEGADNYKIQIVSPSFDSIHLLISDTIVPLNVFKIHLNKGRYSWRVQAVNEGSSSILSDSKYLTIE